MSANVFDACRLPGQQQLNTKAGCRWLPALRPSWHRRQLRMQPSAACVNVPKRLSISGAAQSAETEPEQRSALSKRYRVPDSIVNKEIRGILSQENDGELIIQPGYQRGFVWKEPKCSRLIETILSGLPIQEVWLHEQHSGNLEVIDGQQRLTTIRAFKLGHLPNFKPFKLQGLQDSVHLNGKGFKDLALVEQRRFESYRICCRVVMPEAELEGVFEVYQRMNTGSENLNAQQVCRAAYRGPYIEMLDALAQEHMSKLKSTKAPFTKDEDRELILRFFALSNRLKDFKAPLYKFLNAELQQNQHLDKDDERTYRANFKSTFELAESIYGIEVFRRWDGHKYYGAAVDVSLWDTVMLTLQGYNRAELQPCADALRKKMLKLKVDPNFMPQPRLSRSVIEARVRKLQTSIEIIRGTHQHRHGARNRLFSSDLKNDLFQANPRCTLCKQKILRIEDAQVDHINPYAEGGQTERGNAQLLHIICNQKKSNKLLHANSPWP